MRCVTPGSIAYIATQVRFALTSSLVFSRTDTVMDTERFYTSILELLEDPYESQEVHDLYVWWNRYVLLQVHSTDGLIGVHSALAKIREKRAMMQARIEAGPEVFTIPHEFRRNPADSKQNVGIPWNSDRN
ncbi:uncharacterized protein LACBIDRAFT_310060 [Laccaria bicolor S238N-H82]|uniref:Predicted protein n=1 Tax=Laccaria bicolor (strain S238N-H82 / ATCC MYA-4686) TaxID=486041 RepID=B0DTK5_LACBS|nr:uncharacterized protein LACBIDRAFT_310060 [Laccaria bicolor S238N-H82]EDR02076.1 predicted protein [Laccaria bicolor S238N-H82]|eukprot:XP_001887233.1 predicted protein [Laccaria bicolor S238N-H82]